MLNHTSLSESNLDFDPLFKNRFPVKKIMVKSRCVVGDSRFFSFSLVLLIDFFLFKISFRFETTTNPQREHGISLSQRWYYHFSPNTVVGLEKKNICPLALTSSDKRAIVSDYTCPLPRVLQYVCGMLGYFARRDNGRKRGRNYELTRSRFIVQGCVFRRRIFVPTRNYYTIIVLKTIDHT